MPPFLSRRAFLAGAAALPVAATLPPPARSASLNAPFNVGAFTVLPLLDGPFGLTPQVMPQADSREGDKLLEQAGLPLQGPWPQPVNAFAIQRGERTYLVDTGAGTSLGPDLGRLPERLATLGIDPARVDAVLLTHLHADHSGGLMTPDGHAFFANAEVVVQQAEVAFWTDDGAFSQAHPALGQMFTIARAALAAYPGRVRRVVGAAEAVPGIRFVPLPGHTPGHAGFLLADGGAQFLIFADVIHSALLQFPNPSWTVLFDVDPAIAAATRAGLFDRLTVDRIPCTGSHIPDRGRIETRGLGYALVD